MSHKLLSADYPSCGKCRKEAESVGRWELLRSVITNVDLGQIPVIVSIGGPGRDTNYIERTFATGRFPVIPLNGKHPGNIVLTRQGSTVVDRPLQIDIIPGISSFYAGKPGLIGTFTAVVHHIRSKNY